MNEMEFYFSGDLRLQEVVSVYSELCRDFWRLLEQITDHIFLPNPCEKLFLVTVKRKINALWRCGKSYTVRNCNISYFIL